MGRGLLVSLLLLTTIVAHPTGWAWPVEGEYRLAQLGAELQPIAEGVSLSQARTMAVERFPGTVVRAETRMRNGRRVHQIRIAGVDGRVRDVRIDAQTGAFL
jgi:uncharacterized membrane protein YkoI